MNLVLFQIMNEPKHIRIILFLAFVFQQNCIIIT